MLFFLLLVLGAHNCLQTEDNALKLILDQTELMMAGGTEFDPTYYKKLISYMDEAFLETQIASWQGMIDYFDSNGTDTDHWGSCTDPAFCKQYMEKNLTAMAYHGIEIY